MYTMSLKSTSVSPPTVVTIDLTYCLLYCVSRYGSMVQYGIGVLEIVGSSLLNFFYISATERQLMDCQM